MASFDETNVSESSIVRKRLETLSAQRFSLETEAEAIHSELTSPGLNGEPPAGIKDSLIDSEGYPRGDVDIYNIKAKRKRLAEINTDHKALMKLIESELSKLHACKDYDVVVTATTAGAEGGTDKQQRTDSSASTTVPLAVLDEILTGSPAADAGIKELDLLMRFGHVDSSTPGALNEIVALVKKSVGLRVPLVIKRGSETKSLILVPAVWGGRGLLGCHLGPVPAMTAHS